MASNKTKAQLYKEVLTTNKKKQTNLRFPADLDTEGTGNIIRFSFNLPSGSKYLGNGQYQKAVDPKTGQTQTSTYRSREAKNSANIARRFSDNYVRTTSNVDLYMPPQIQSSYSADWGQEDLGILGGAIDAGFKLANLDSWQGAEDSWQVVKNTVPESLMNAFAGTLQALTPFNFVSAKKAATSTMVNPYTEVLFNGVKNRTFSFTFKMIPRNRLEQTLIKNIVDEFKFHMAPEVKYVGQTNYWLFPSEVDVKFIHRLGENPWLFKISTCAITDVSVDHSPEGQYAAHDDGSPFATSLTIQLTEMEALTKARHKEGY